MKREGLKTSKRIDRNGSTAANNAWNKSKASGDFSAACVQRTYFCYFLCCIISCD